MRRFPAREGGHVDCHVSKRKTVPAHRQPHDPTLRNGLTAVGPERDKMRRAGHENDRQAPPRSQRSAGTWPGFVWSQGVASHGCRCSHVARSCGRLAPGCTEYGVHPHNLRQSDCPRHVHVHVQGRVQYGARRTVFLEYEYVLTQNRLPGQGSPVTSESRACPRLPRVHLRLPGSYEYIPVEARA